MKLDDLQLRILLYCLKFGSLSKSKLTGVLRKYTTIEKDIAVSELIESGLIEKEIRVIEDDKTRKHPTFYSLTTEGKNWLKNYKKRG